MLRKAGRLTSVCVLGFAVSTTSVLIGAEGGKAFAKNDRSESAGANGNGNGNNGRSGEKSRGNGGGEKSRGNSDKAKSQNNGTKNKNASTGSSRAKPKPWWLEDADDVPGQRRKQQQSDEDGTMFADDDYGASRSLGSVDGQMGALNAAHAKPVALERANTDSRVGRIAAYKAGLESLSVTQDDLQTARDKLDTLDPPERELSDIRADLRETRASVRQAREEVARLEEELETAGGSDADIEADLATARNRLRDARAARDEDLEELAEAVAYLDAQDAVEALEDEVTLSEAEALTLLKSAANKPLNNDVIAEVNRLLGLEDVVLTLPDEEATPAE